MSYILPTATNIASSTGFWMPHSASVDFCEPNYMHSQYIAEFHNVWSSVFISVLAVLGMIFSNPLHDKRTLVMFSTLFAIGVGSVALHATLRDFGQSADEVPMLWVNISMLFCLSTLQTRKSAAYTWYSALLWFGIGTLQTVAYFTMRHVYDFFLFSFVSTSALLIIWTAKVALSDRSSPDFALRWFLYSRSIISFLFIGFALWLFEMNHCASLLPYYAHSGGATFHIMWHIGSGVGGYLLILLMIAVRMQSMGGVADLQWLGGLLPVIAIAGPKENPIIANAPGQFVACDVGISL